MDFVSARTADGRWFRTLTVIDVFTRVGDQRERVTDL